MASFVEQHGLWTAEQARAGAELAKRFKSGELDVVRFAFPDQHGILRGKTLVAAAAASALASGWPWAVPVRAAVSGVWAATCRSTPRNSAKVSCVKRTTLREPSVFQKSGPGWASA